MIMTTAKIDGMMCSMCESHVNDIVRKTTKVKKVKSSHKKNLTIITMESRKDLDLIVSAIKSLGYECNIKDIEEC